MEATDCAKISVFMNQGVCCHIPEDNIL